MAVSPTAPAGRGVDDDRRRIADGPHQAARRVPTRRQASAQRPSDASLAVPGFHLGRGGAGHRALDVGRTQLVPPRAEFRPRAPPAGRPQSDLDHHALRDGREGGIQPRVREWCPPDANSGSRPPPAVAGCRPCLHRRSGWHDRELAAGASSAAARQARSHAACRTHDRRGHADRCTRADKPGTRCIRPAGVLSGKAAAERSYRGRGVDHRLSDFATAVDHVRRSGPRRHR